MSDAQLFPGFEAREIDASGASIHCVVGGKGPPLLLLHGYPQTHAIWHRVAPRLAERYTVVCADLRGYGDSSKPPGDTEHATYSKRAMANDMVELMQSLGFTRFRLAGHDRGGRVSHRLAIDHPDRVERVALLDISPTRIMFARTNHAFASAYYHWFFLSQPFDLPERLIGADPLYYLHRKLGAWSPSGLEKFDPRALAEYERCFANEATIHATCEDYRAAATIDIAHEEADVAAGRKIECPLLVLWGEKGVVNRLYKPLVDWSEVATDVRGGALPCGHYLAEEAPEETFAELSVFLEERG
ncbi:MAG TPA: alpha/beta hydrolase [Casimicrobiaceae bacterium]|nr:alpha/beta hydrolase [Casimicrobiaceae bacterium]